MLVPWASGGRKGILEVLNVPAFGHILLNLYLSSSTKSGYETVKIKFKM